jgi:uncharacterized membrane protein HdeD (DUF308 family)
VRYTDPVSAEIKQQVRASSGWGIVIGIMMMILGTIAIARPLYATIASAIVFGWLFMAAGIAQILYAGRSPAVGQRIWKFSLGILYVITGLYAIINPLSGAIALPLVLGVTIFIQGSIQIISAFQMRPTQTWAWILFCGITSIILGIFIWSNFPYSADWLLGLWVGIHFLLSGICILILSVTLRSALK